MMLGVSMKALRSRSVVLSALRGRTPRDVGHSSHRAFPQVLCARRVPKLCFSDCGELSPGSIYACSSGLCIAVNAPNCDSLSRAWDLHACTLGTTFKT